jgi:hypothetical protein
MSLVGERLPLTRRTSLLARLVRRAWTFLRENDLSGLDGVQL